MMIAITAIVMTAVLLHYSAALSRQTRLVLACLCFVAMLLPWPLGGAAWLLSYVSHFSLASLLLALNVIQGLISEKTFFEQKQRNTLFMLLCVIAPGFYVLSMGATLIDPYAWGFGDFQFSTGILLLGLYFWISRYYTLCLWLVLSQVMWRLELLPSDNLWDYLIDPWVVIWAPWGWWYSRQKITPTVTSTQQQV